MEPFTSIVVDVDAAAPAHPALERAARLARRCGARITITDVLTVPASARGYMPPDLEERMAGERRQQLDRIVRSVDGVEATPKLLTGRPATALIQEVLAGPHDLLVRSHARGLAAPEPRPYGATDLELLRKCPCPVMLVRHGARDPAPRIVAAVDASAADAAEHALNVKIVEHALLLAELEGGTLSLLQAWAPFGERTIRTHAGDDAFTSYVDGARSRSAADLAGLAREFGDRLAGVQSVLRRGQPGEVIPEYVVTHGIDLVVMGTVGRGGISGLLFGNTAERILRKLPCSVLAVKPAGFESPVRPDEPGRS
jgi:nucleotide-binding universal stress UspA family protein